MTTYTFELPKKNTNNIATIYKESLMDKVLNAYPWLAGKSKPKSSITYDLLAISNPCGITGISATTCKNCPFYKESALTWEDEFFNALAAIKNYAKDYDFEDDFGNPVRIFDNFIQVGYDIIPIAPGSLNYLKPKEKKTIIDITIKVKKNGWL